MKERGAIGSLKAEQRAMAEVEKAHPGSHGPILARGVAEAGCQEPSIVLRELGAARLLQIDER